MTCHPINIPGLGVGFVCTRTKAKRCKCGLPAALLCDWKVPSKKSGTCDRPICDRCSTSPAPDKDLCSEHAGAFEKWRESR